LVIQPEHNTAVLANTAFLAFQALQVQPLTFLHSL